jgi:hypothetical protein
VVAVIKTQMTARLNTEPSESERESKVLESKLWINLPLCIHPLVLRVSSSYILLLFQSRLDINWIIAQKNE